MGSPAHSSPREERSLEFAVRKDKPWATGTGFYFNGNGQVLTAAHVIQECAKIDVKRDDKVLPAKVIARSHVIDLAARDTGAPSPAFLPFRSSLSLELGEPVTDVGFPLQDILSQSPNLTRGNISARGGLTGSEGQIQFSAPVQPGSSGGPVVSDGGEVLGITVGTLSAPATSYKYSTTVTRVRNIWTQDKTHGLGEDGIKWARSTVDLFVKDAAADPKLMALRTEFNYYFGSAKP
jgi:serine protease Do